MVPVAEATPRVLGRLLVGAGAISEAELAAALDEQTRTRERLGEVLVRRGADPEQIARAMALQLRLPYLEPPLRPEPAALRLVDRVLAVRLRVLPITQDERMLRVAMADPLNSAALDDLRFQTARRVEAAVALPDAVDDALRVAYGPAAVQALLGRLAQRPAAKEAEPESADVNELRRASEAPPIVALVDLVVTRAVELGASDVHIEPMGQVLRVRVRVDGELRPMLELPADARAPVVSRIKIMAGLDIAVKRQPQDGRGLLHACGRDMGLRVSTLPTETGEKVVLRLLDPRNAGLRMEELGLGGTTRERLDRLLRRRHGVLLVTGPTGSGKTTTLYAALAGFDRERLNVVTLEDPVEYRLQGVTQVQVHKRAGLGFATALRSVLRQDPDVVMVGEMRDRETAEVAMAAALTGHFVLSTLHTNDAAGAVTRLLDLGAPAYLSAAGLAGVLAQRLARRLCRYCRAERTPEPGLLESIGANASAGFRAVGCARCGGTGYSGRIAVAELLLVDARIRDLILRGAPSDGIRQAAGETGMVPMGMDALDKVANGETSLEEVAPLLGLLAEENPACPRCGVPARASFMACVACGLKLREACGCGQTLADGWQFCPACARPRSPAS